MDEYFWRDGVAPFLLEILAQLNHCLFAVTCGNFLCGKGGRLNKLIKLFTDVTFAFEKLFGHFVS